MADTEKSPGNLPPAKTQGLRTLVIAAVFGVFLSSVVFVVLTYLFVVPRLVDHERRIYQLEANAAAVEEEVEAEEEEAAEPDAQPATDGGAPEVVPAVAPAATTDAGQ